MDIATGIERLVAIAFVINGLSHIVAPRAWAAFFIQLRERGAPGGFLNAWIHIPLGLLIVSFHWLWSWPELIVTLIGCGLTLKGTLYFLWPSLALKSMAHVSLEKAASFRIAGVASVLLGLVGFWVSLGAPGR